MPVAHQLLRHGKTDMRPEVQLSSLEDGSCVVFHVVVSTDQYPPTYLQKVSDECISFYAAPLLSQLGPGVHVWSAGWALAKFFMWRELNASCGGSCAGQTVLELGAGTGIVGLTLAQLGAQVTLTDFEPSVLDLLRLNVAVNCLGFGVESSYLVGEQNLIVAADVLYNDPHGQLFAQTIDAHVRVASATEVYLAYLHRDSDDQLDFFSAVLEMGFRLERFEDKHGNSLGASKGDALSAYDSGSFVVMPAATIPDSGRQALISDGNSENIQIFRITRPSVGVI